MNWCPSVRSIWLGNSVAFVLVHLFLSAGFLLFVAAHPHKFNVLGWGFWFRWAFVVGFGWQAFLSIRWVPSLPIRARISAFRTEFRVNKVGFATVRVILVFVFVLIVARQFPSYCPDIFAGIPFSVSRVAQPHYPGFDTPEWVYYASWSTFHSPYLFSQTISDFFII